MSGDYQPLPSFGAPPVNEVVLDVQFAPLERLGTAELGSLRREYRDRYPKVAEHAPLDRRDLVLEKRPKVEVAFQLETFDLPPLRRLWFISEDETQLIQVQSDRFIYNWRRIKDEPYPRYERIRETFVREYEVFRRFLEREALGAIVPDGCEVSYINQITADDNWQRHGQLHEVVNLWAPRRDDAFLPEPDAVQFVVGYLIPDSTGRAVGRLKIVVQPAIRKSDGSEMLAMNLAASIRPSGTNENGVLSAMDLGRAWIVRAFKDVTTARMHEAWRLEHDS